MIKIEEVAEISNRELIKHIDVMKDEDRTWLIDRLNQMDTFSKEVWQFKTSALKLQKRKLGAFEILDFLKECNKVQSVFLNKLKKLKYDT